MLLNRDISVLGELGRFGPEPLQRANQPPIDAGTVLRWLSCQRAAAARCSLKLILVPICATRVSFAASVDACL